MITRLWAYILLRMAHRNFRKGKYARGIEFLERIVSFCPNYHFAYYHLGCRFIELREFSRAQDYYLQALTHSPNNSVYHTFLGIAFYEQGAYDQARDSFATAINLDPDNRLTHNYLALCCLAESRVDEFKQIIEKHGIFESDDLQIRLSLALERHLESQKKQ